ncbi:MAG: aminoglycoside phosphotransferase family protein [Gammaproteobacteria bacterium]|nr:aminoglycoside phosphotransferase family protein [Gammaproteobacteria bacterium]
MELAIRLGVDRLLGTTVDQPVGPEDGFQFNGWLNQVRGALEDDRASAVVFWPPQTSRRRIYVHLFDASQKPIGFAKISFGDEDDRLLMREADILVQQTEAGVRSFRVPRVLAVGETDAGHQWLVTAPLPERTRPIGRHYNAYPDQIVAALSGEHRLVPHTEMTALSWWPEDLVTNGPEVTEFGHELEALVANEGVKVCRVHGDFGLQNMVIDRGGTRWVFDWEQSRPDGPVMADQVSFFLALDPARTSADPLSALRRFHEQFLKKASPQRRCQIMMALAFRHATGALDAGLFINNWAKQGR